MDFPRIEPSGTAPILCRLELDTHVQIKGVSLVFVLTFLNFCSSNINEGHAAAFYVCSDEDLVPHG